MTNMRYVIDVKPKVITGVVVFLVSDVNRRGYHNDCSERSPTSTGVSTCNLQLAPQVFFKLRGTLSLLKFSITAPVVVFLLTALIVITPFLRKVIQMVRLNMTSREVGNSGSWQRMSSPWSPVVRSLKRDFNERRRIHRSRALAASELGVRSSCCWAELILCLFFSLLLILLIFNHFELSASYLVYCILHAESA